MVSMLRHQAYTRMETASRYLGASQTVNRTEGEKDRWHLCSRGEFETVCATSVGTGVLKD